MSNFIKGRVIFKDKSNFLQVSCCPTIFNANACYIKSGNFLIICTYKIKSHSAQTHKFNAAQIGNFNGKLSKLRI